MVETDYALAPPSLYRHVPVPGFSKDADQLSDRVIIDPVHILSVRGVEVGSSVGCDDGRERGRESTNEPRDVLDVFEDASEDCDVMGWKEGERLVVEVAVLDVVWRVDSIGREELRENLPARAELEDAFALANHFSDQARSLIPQSILDISSANHFRFRHFGLLGWLLH